MCSSQGEGNVVGSVKGAKPRTVEHAGIAWIWLSMVVQEGSGNDASIANAPQWYIEKKCKKHP